MGVVRGKIENKCFFTYWNEKKNKKQKQNVFLKSEKYCLIFGSQKKYKNM